MTKAARPWSRRPRGRRLFIAWHLPSRAIGYVSLIMFSPMGSFMTELYPAAVRGVGQGFCYNAGRGIGALFPALVGFLSIRLGLGAAIAIFSLVAYGLMIVALLLPETRGRSLRSLEGAAAE